jgi:hypothetical protein
MYPLATVCSLHGTWLTPVATRTLVAIRHAGDLHRAVQHVSAEQALPKWEHPYAGDALWLQALCDTGMDVTLPWGRIRPNAVTWIVGAVARAVMSAPDSDDSACCPSANRRSVAVKDFTFETAGAQRDEHVAANAAATPPVRPGLCRARPTMGARGEDVPFLMVSRISRAACIDGKLARGSARLGVPQSGRAAPETGRVAKAVQHLAKLLQGLFGSACIVPVNRSTSAAPISPKRCCSQIIRPS